MKITKLVHLDPVEVEISIDAEDIQATLAGLEPDKGSFAVSNALNCCAQVIRAIPDAEIERLSDAAKKVVTEFFMAQAARFSK